MKLTWEQLADIRTLAKGATPGPWSVDGLGNIFRKPQAKDEDWQPIALLTKSSLDEHAPTEANAAYIAAASPDVVLAMITRIEMLDEAKKIACGSLYDLYAEAHARAERLEKEADWLALVLANHGCGMPLSEYINEDTNVMSPPAPEHWREAARKTVEKQCQEP